MNKFHMQLIYNQSNVIHNPSRPVYDVVLQVTVQNKYCVQYAKLCLHLALQIKIMSIQSLRSAPNITTNICTKFKSTIFSLLSKSPAVTTKRNGPFYGQVM